METEHSQARDTPKTRIARRPLHGVLLLDKPLGLSSNDALQKAKWLLRAEKAGHTGTLDPLASGVLPLCFGAATKFSQLQLDADKTYEALARLGVTTDTGDAEGAVVQQRPVHVTQADVDRVRSGFLGTIRQMPPMYSALKKGGKPLYEYARAGIEVERQEREVTIHALTLALELDAAGHGSIRMQVTCSKGTYIRTLGQDIGEVLGCGAHLSYLRRTAAGGFSAAQCLRLEQLEALADAERAACLLPVDCLLDGHTVVTLGADDAGCFLSGLRRRGNWPDAARVAVYGEEPRALLGTAHVRVGELIPGRLLSPIEITQSLAQRP